MATISRLAYQGLLEDGMVGVWSGVDPVYSMTMAKELGVMNAPVSQLFDIIGRTQMISDIEWSGLAKSPYNPSVETNTNTSEGSAAAAVDVTIKSAYVADGKSYLRAGDIVSIGDTRTLVQVSEVKSAGVVSLKPLLAANTVPAITAGTYLTVVTSSKARGTGQPDPVNIPYYKHEFNMQVIAETAGAIGGYQSQKMYAATYEDGSVINSVYDDQILDAETRFELKRTGAALVGELNDNLAGDDHPTTQGIITGIRSYGHNILAGFDDFDDYYAVATYLRSQGVASGTNIMALCGALFQNQTEQIMPTELLTSGVDFRERFGVTKYDTETVNSYMANFNTRAFSISNFLFSFVAMPDFDNPDFLGRGYSNSCTFLPMTKYQDSLGASGISNSVELRYVGDASYSDRNRQIWWNGAARPSPRFGDLDNAYVYFLSDMGVHHMNRNQGVFGTV